MADTPDLSVNIASVATSLLPSASRASISAPGGSELTPFEKLSPIQKLIVTTLATPPHLYDRPPNAKVNIRLAYARYLEVLDTFTAIAKMTASGTWPDKKKKPTNDDMIEIFVSKTTWFKSHSKIFPLVNRSHAMESWLRIEDGAPTDFEVWGYQKQTFDALMDILSVLPGPTDTKKEEEEEAAVSEPGSSPVAVKKKKVVVDKGKKKGGKKEGGKKEGGKNASTSKTRHADK